MTQVFVSYAHQDLEAAGALVGWLKQSGLKVWWDQSLSPGDEYRRLIRDQIREAQSVIVIWSDRSCVSRWVIDEAEQALDLGKLIPVCVPGFSLERTPHGYRSLHTVNINDIGSISRSLTRLGVQIETPRSQRLEATEDLKYEIYTIPTFDGVLKRKDEELCNRLKKIRAFVAPDLRAIPITHYSHNSLSHAVQCTNLGVEIFSREMDRHLRSEEVFLFGLFCVIHDVGMATRKDQTPEEIYRAHNVYAQEYVMKLGARGLLSGHECDQLAALCLMHNKPLDRARVHFDRLRALPNRLPILFSMFRVVDMLDVETQAGEILRIKPEIVRQVIGELDFDPKCRRLTIWKSRQISDAVFIEWQNFFEDRLAGFNRELQKIRGAISLKIA